MCACVHVCVCVCVHVCVVRAREVLIDKVTLGSASGASGRSIRQAGSLETEALPSSFPEQTVVD